MIAWTIVAMLWVGSLFALATRANVLGILGVTIAGFFAAALMFEIPWIFVCIFWITWAISALVTIRQMFKDRFVVGRWLATTALPSFALLSAIAIFAIAGPMASLSGASNTTQMALPLPGGGVQIVPVVGSLKINDVTLDERVQLYKDIAAKECPSGVRYFANEAEPGTNQNGPTLRVDTVEAAKYRADIKKVCDPLALAEMVHAIKYGHHLIQAQVEAEAKSYLADPAKRAAAVQFVDSQVAEYHIVDAHGWKYKSLGMVPGKNGEMPTLTQFANHPDLGYALVTVLKDGTVRHWRIICDIQFSSPEEIVGVAKPEKAEVPPNTVKYPPTVATTPPSTTKTTPSTETTTSTSTSTTTTTPGTSTSTTTTTTPPSSTTTTTETTSTTTSTTTTTSPPTSTTTTSTKGTVTVPTGLPTGTTQGPPDTTDPVEPTVQDPGSQPGNTDPGQGSPGGTQEPTQEPVPTVLPTDGADPTNPHEGDVEPGTTTVQAMAMGGTSTSVSLAGGAAFILLVGGSIALRRKENAGTIG